MFRLFLSTLILLLLSACFRQKDTIRVTYVNARTQEVIERMEIGIDQLPDNFRERTGMILRGERYGVLDADPSQKEAIARSGQLRLMVLPLDDQPRSEVFYSMPTISAELPAIVDGAVAGEAFRVQEDDWRQVEVVSGSFASLVREELQDIKRIYDNEKQDAGFTGLHVRSRIESPLAAQKLSVAELQESFPAVRNYGGVVYDATGAKISGGFAWQTESGVVLWGTASDEGIHQLCLHGLPRLEQATEWATQLAEFLRARECLFVDWVWLFSVSSDASAIEGYLGQRLGNG